MKNASSLPAGLTETRVLNQREGGAPAVADDVARDARFRLWLLRKGGVVRRV
jgi:hypothetical protein